MDKPAAEPRILRIIHQIEDGFLGILLLILIILAFFQIAGRLFFNSGIRGIDPILYHLVLCVALLGAAIATREREHINIDVVTRIVSFRTQHLIHAITNLVSSAVSFILMWEGYRFVRDELSAGTLISDRIPAWIFQSVIPLAFGIMGIRFFIHVIQDIRRFSTGRTHP